MARSRHRRRTPGYFTNRGARVSKTYFTNPKAKTVHVYYSKYDRRPRRGNKRLRA